MITLALRFLRLKFATLTRGFIRRRVTNVKKPLVPTFFFGRAAFLTRHYLTRSNFKIVGVCVVVKRGIVGSPFSSATISPS